jgi:hypothetical protein
MNPADVIREMREQAREGDDYPPVFFATLDDWADALEEEIGKKDAKIERLRHRCQRKTGRITRLGALLADADMELFEQGCEIERLRSVLEALRYEHPIGLSGKAFDIIEDALK